MKPPVFDQTENLALGQINKRRGALRRDHLDRRSALRAKRRQRLRDSPQDDRLLDFERDFRFSFHKKKNCTLALSLASRHKSVKEFCDRGA